MNAQASWVFLDVDHPMVAWSTYIGRIESVRSLAGGDASSAVSLRAADLIRQATNDEHPDRLVAEAGLERIRAQEFPEATSRLHGVYFFEDRYTAERASAEWRVRAYRPENLAEVGFAATQTTRADAEWITNCLLEPDDEWKRRYWRGEPHGSKPIWEVINEGAGLVWDIDLRHRAWDRCVHEFPEAQVLLDTGRIANELNFRIGLVLPVLVAIGPATARLDYILDMRDADNDSFLRAFAEYTGPRNASWDGATLHTPDFRPQGFEFQINALESLLS